MRSWLVVDFDIYKLLSQYHNNTQKFFNPDKLLSSNLISNTILNKCSLAFIGCLIIGSKKVEFALSYNNNYYYFYSYYRNLSVRKIISNKTCAELCHENVERAATFISCRLLERHQDLSMQQRSRRVPTEALTTFDTNHPSRYAAQHLVRSRTLLWGRTMPIPCTYSR